MAFVHADLAVSYLKSCLVIPRGSISKGKLPCVTFLFLVFLLLTLTTIVVAINWIWSPLLTSSLSLSYFKKALGTDLHLNEVCPSKAASVRKLATTSFLQFYQKALNRKRKSCWLDLTFKTFKILRWHFWKFEKSSSV